MQNTSYAAHVPNARVPIRTSTYRTTTLGRGCCTLCKYCIRRVQDARTTAVCGVCRCGAPRLSLLADSPQSSTGKFLAAFGFIPLHCEPVRLFGIHLVATNPKHKPVPEFDETAQAAVMDALIEAIVIIDESGQIERCNKAAVEMFGYSKDEMAGKDLSILMPASGKRQSPELCRTLSADARGTDHRHRARTQRTAQGRHDFSDSPGYRRNRCTAARCASSA